MMPEENQTRSKRNKILLSLTVLLLAVLFVILFMIFGSTSDNIPAVTEDEPYSTLICTGTDSEAALLEVRDAYDQAGDAAAFSTAQKYIDAGVCEYSEKNNLFWWQRGTAPEGFEAFEEVDCQMLSNGHCVAIQRIYEYDEENEVIISTGHMLVEPRVASGTPPEATTAARSQKGLILDLNY